MAQPPPDFTPLDPGRIHADDPMEITYWSMQLGCSTTVLTDLVARHGEHVTVVREALAQRAPDTPNDTPAGHPRGEG
ncbi:MAG: DUF3606 domain-containing protein [Burkholderiaceae bacterium]|nr:DUF3606 domain-containing protein [Burkholderiaceae bacterium]